MEKLHVTFSRTITNDINMDEYDCQSIGNNFEQAINDFIDAYYDFAYDDVPIDVKKAMITAVYNYMLTDFRWDPVNN